MDAEYDELEHVCMQRLAWQVTACSAPPDWFLADREGDVALACLLLQVQELGLSVSPDYSLPMLLSTPAHVQGWKRPGLSPDEASIDSAALVLCSPAWPFIIDSQVLTRTDRMCKA